jgi:hypothetical protein
MKIMQLLRTCLSGVYVASSTVLEQAYLSANAVQKQELLAEFYSPEFRLFKGMITAGKGRVVDLLATEPAAKRRAVLEHMTLALQPILEKGIVDHSIIHRAIVEYLSISKKSMIQEVVQQLSGALLVRMLHTRDGAKVGVTCVMHGSNKDRKKIVKGMKGHVSKIARDEHGSMVLLSLFDVMDDTQLVTKVCYLQLSVLVLSHKLYLRTDPHRKCFAGHHQRDHERPTGAGLAQEWTACNFVSSGPSSHTLFPTRYLGCLGTSGTC